MVLFGMLRCVPTPGASILWNDGDTCGNWTTLERFRATRSGAASATPTRLAGRITICAGHTVAICAQPKGIDQHVLQAGATVVVANSMSQPGARPLIQFNSSGKYARESINNEVMENQS